MSRTHARGELGWGGDECRVWDAISTVALLGVPSPFAAFGVSPSPDGRGEIKAGSCKILISRDVLGLLVVLAMQEARDVDRILRGRFAVFLRCATSGVGHALEQRTAELHARRG